MSTAASTGPVKGVLGVLAAREELGCLSRLRARGLGGVEVRADLLMAAGETFERVLELVRELAAAGTPVLLTIRRHDQGGAYRDDDASRVELFRRGLEAGAGLVDVEWGSEAARALASTEALREHLLLSQHDFEGMPSSAELDDTTSAMESLRPRAIKFVPTASSLADGLRMLDWVAAAGADGPGRAGFAMGPPGVPSRVLSISRGAPFTYANLGAAVAPGQVHAAELLETYAAHELAGSCRVFGVVGDRALDSFSPYLHNPALRARGISAVYLPFQVEDFADVTSVLDAMRIDGLSVTIPFKQDAHAFAGTLDDRSERSGATNTLVVRRDPGVSRAGAVRGYNTDYDGVLLPLSRRLDSLKKLSVAVIGNGGAARGAVLALKEAGALPTIYYRSEERGAPVAEELGVSGKPIDELSGFRGRVLINATPLGGSPDDPSPAPASAFVPRSGGKRRVAFEMIYEPAEAAFLRAAAEAGAECIPGREMLVAQGVVQFRRFTGSTPDDGELDANYAAGGALRRWIASGGGEG